MESNMKIRQMAIIGVITAVICILGPLSIPIGVVPITFTNLAIYFALYTLGMRKGTLSYIIYMLIGLAGLPVFSGFSGGLPKLVGPTGGYIIGFIFMALIGGCFIDKFWDKWYLSLVGMVIGTAICYLFGTVWLAYQAHMSLGAAFSVGVIPFIMGDMIKILIAALVGPQIRKGLMKANLFRVSF
jgi:biotin transport system substrate-specific component